MTAEFVDDATGYSWSYVYNGFYHADGSQLLSCVLYLCSGSYYKFDLSNSVDKFDITAYICVHKILDIGAWNMRVSAGGSASVDVALDDISAYFNDLSFEDYSERVFINRCNIINDASASIISLMDGGYFARGVTNFFKLYVDVAGQFDNVNYDNAVMNRGHIHYFLYV